MDNEHINEIMWTFKRILEKMNDKEDHEVYNDKEYRTKMLPKIKEFLLTLKQNNVKIRRDLQSYVRYDSEIRPILVKTGWMPLDAFYMFENQEEEDRWLNVEMIINDETINQALKEYVKPYNRDWCNCLASDF